MKEISAPTSGGYVIFCDDIRSELGGKLTLVGVYGPNMLFEKPLPVTVPKLAMLIKYVEKLGESTDPLELWIFLPGDANDNPSIVQDVPYEQLRNMPTTPNADKSDVKIAAAVNLAISPIVFTQPGRIKVRMRRGDDLIKLGSIRVEAPTSPAPIQSDEAT